MDTTLYRLTTDFALQHPEPSLRQALLFLLSDHASTKLGPTGFSSPEAVNFVLQGFGEAPLAAHELTALPVWGGYQRRMYKAGESLTFRPAHFEDALRDELLQKGVIFNPAAFPHQERDVGARKLVPAAEDVTAVQDSFGAYIGSKPLSPDAWPASPGTWQYWIWVPKSWGLGKRACEELLIR